MEQIASLTLLVLFILAKIRELLLHAYWWQVKEYRFDRFWVFLKTREGKAVVTPLHYWIKLLLLLASPPLIFTRGYSLWYAGLVGAVFLVEDLVFASELFSRKIRKPVFTLRAQRILLTGIFVGVAFIATGYFVGFQSDLLLWAIILLVFDKALPITVPAGIAWTQLSVNRTKEREVRLAKENLASIKNLVSVGITGSYGKTSTKEFLAQILSTKFNVAKTTGSENTEFGIARKIQQYVAKDTEVFIAEMGAYKKGEIKRLADIVQPKIGVVAGIAPQHLELFGSLTNLIETKYELIEALPSDGVAIFNGSNSYCQQLAKKTRKIPVIIYQIRKPKNDANIFWADEIKAGRDRLSFVVHWRGKSSKFNVNLLGRQFVENILGAAACAAYLGISLFDIAKAVQKIRPIERTMEPKELKSGTMVIDDTYNTNPAGFNAALDYLEGSDFTRRFVVTAGIIELGDQSEKIHVALGRRLAKIANRAFLTSNDFYEYLVVGFSKTKEKLILEKDPGKIAAKLLSEVGENDAILLEGRVPEMLRQKLIQL